MRTEKETLKKVRAIELKILKRKTLPIQMLLRLKASYEKSFNKLVQFVEDYADGKEVSLEERDKWLWKEQIYNILSCACQMKLGYLPNDKYGIEILCDVKPPANLGKWLFDREELKKVKFVRKGWSKYAS